MSRTGESIYKRKDGRWEGRYIKGRTPQGKAIYGYVYGRTYTQTKERLYQMAAGVRMAAGDQMPAVVQLTAGARMAVGTPLTPQHPLTALSICITFEVLAENWLLTRRTNVKESSYIRYRNLLQHYILPRLGETPVPQITVDTLNEFYVWLLTEAGRRHQGLSPKTTSDVISIVRSILRYARIQHIPTSCTGTEITMRTTRREMRILSTREQGQLVQYLIDHPSPRSLGLLLCLYTGMRLGEICALRWEDISMQDRTIYIHQTMQRIQCTETSGSRTAVIVTSPKSACSIRTIPVPPMLQDLLEEYHVESGYLLTGTEAYVEPRTMENHFQRVLQAADLPRVNYHCLRHTFATRCVEVGFDIKTLSEILGHANITITMNRYVHPTMQMKRENMDRLSTLFLVN